MTMGTITPVQQMLPYMLNFIILSHLTDVKGMTQSSKIMDTPKCLHCEYNNSHFCTA